MNLKNLFNGSSIMSSMFRQVPGVVLDLLSSSIGFYSPEGIVTYKNGVVGVHPLVDAGMSIPAYAVRTNLSDLRQGDLVALSEIEYAFVRSVTAAADGQPATLHVITQTGEQKSIVPTANMLLGGGAILAVRNVFGNLNLGAAANGSIDGFLQNPLMAMAFLGGDDKSDLFPLLMMSQLSGQQGGMNPLLMMSLLGDDKGSGGSLKDLMMFQMFAGAGAGANPLAGLFGAVAAPAQAAAAAE